MVASDAMDFIIPILIAALFGALAASHKDRRVWLWAVLCSLLPISLFVLAFNRCFRCETSERNRGGVHLLIGLSAPAIFVGLLVYNFDFEDSEREKFRITSETPRNPNARYHSEKMTMLRLINNQRQLAGVPPVKLSNNEAAQLHAEAMRDHCFVSHWDLDGMKPYMRYSMSGGYQTNAENVAGYYNCGPFDPYDDVEATLSEHVLGFMESEGHRETMLDPYYRKVSIGIATDKGIWVVQHFEGDYVEFDELPQLDAGILSVYGRTREGAQVDEDAAILVDYDPPLRALSVEQLDQTRCYGPGLPIAVLIMNPFSKSDLEDTEVASIVHAELQNLQDANPLLYSGCKDPYKIPVGQNSSSGSRERIKEDVSDEVAEREVRVPFFLVDEWSATDTGEFSLNADIREVVEQHGAGVYTITLIGEVSGDLMSISKYSIFVDL